MEYAQAVRYLESLPTPENWALDAPRKLAELAKVRFNYEIVHIAGTNGKGSTAAFLACILQSAGFKTGLYTSPHLQKYNERMKINGKDIGDGGFAKMIAAIEPFIEKMRSKNKTPSLFEALTIAAFNYFSPQKIDFLVLETGLGGRLDATNIAPSHFQIITSISYDHASNLGGTLPQIAAEKAGIIKPHSFAVTSAKTSALKVIESACEKTYSKIAIFGKDYSVKLIGATERGGVFDYHSARSAFKNLKIPLAGLHQLENAANAIAMSEILGAAGYAIPEYAIRKGLLATRWPGRLELLSKNPPILLDGAHNPGGIGALKDSLQKIYLKNDRKLILILGILADKDYGKMIRTIAPLASKIIFTKPDAERAANPEILMRALPPSAREKAEIIEKVANAIDHVVRTAHSNDLICIAGSLYTVGEARAHLLKTNPAFSLKKKK